MCHSWSPGVKARRVPEALLGGRAIAKSPDSPAEKCTSSVNVSAFQTRPCAALFKHNRSTVGPDAARRIFVTGEKIDAAEALRIGLVNEVCADALARAREVAEQIVAEWTPEQIAALKASFDASWKNLGALAVFGLIFIGLAIVATIPFGLGWLVLLPVMFGGLYASWREVFGE